MFRVSKDIFEFWSEVAPTDKVHPRDRCVFRRLGDVGHGFNLQCLPTCFAGPLRTAPVVLLYLSPGFSQENVDEANTPEAQARYHERRQGYQPLPGRDGPEPAWWQWWSSRTKVFGPWEQLRDKLAILNISAYHSANLTHHHVLAALPSCRATLDWAQETLFPQAERDERVVVCMRSARYWGLSKSGRHRGSLFAPKDVTRSGYLTSKGTNTAILAEVIDAVKAQLAAA